MSPTPDRFRDHLRSEETLRATFPAVLTDEASWNDASVGMTDNRLLCVSDDDAFVTVGYDSICSVRSRPRTTRTLRGNDYRLLLLGGTLVAGLCFVGVVALASSPFVPLLSGLAVGAVAATAFARRMDGPPEFDPVTAIERRATADFDRVAELRRFQGRVTDYADGDELLALGSALVAAVSVAGALLLAANPLVVFLVLPVLGGLAVADFASRHRDEFDGIEVVRRHRREVNITTADGTTVRLESDPAAKIDRELGRLALADDVEPVQVLSARS